MLDRLLALAPRRGWFWLLVLGNLAGSLYGFWWYAEQLAVTPVAVWPWTADSPLSTFFLTGVLLAWWRGRRVPLLEGLAWLGLLKYGFWTVFVLGLWWARGGTFWWVDAMLVATHAFMVLQGMVFARAHRLGPGALGFALAWYVLNDALDYAAGFHPRIPDPAVFGLVRAVSLASTPLFWLAVRRLAGRSRLGAFDRGVNPR